MLNKLLEHAIRELVDKPELVSVKQMQDGDKKFFSIRVDNDDLRRVIGKEGRIIRSLRALTYCFKSEPNELVFDVIPK